MPVGELVTVPVTVPDVETAKVYGPDDGGAKVAVTITFVPAVITHVPVPEHPPPDQPEKMEPASGVAYKVTDVPGL
jgi:hypothetical protein